MGEGVISYSIKNYGQVGEVMTMAGWHAESSKPVAWENNKIELGGEIVRSENGFRRWVLRARGVLDQKRQVC